jgi:protocatechuate 3,4-dioxygenase beta subunit
VVTKFSSWNEARTEVSGTLAAAGLLAAFLVLLTVGFSAAEEPGRCTPTPADALGPFYKPHAPVRSRVGEGYTLTGTVKSSVGCKPIAGARIEFWLTGPDAVYGDDRRATVLSDGAGGYSFESNFPPAYAGRPPHIHVKVTAEGYRTLITQHYPVRGTKEARFDLVLVPVR